MLTGGISVFGFPACCLFVFWGEHRQSCMHCNRQENGENRGGKFAPFGVWRGVLGASREGVQRAE